MARSYAETMGLEFEAERLVRMGESRATLCAIRDGNRMVDAEHALRARMRVFMREAVELLAAGDDAALAELDRRLAGVGQVERLAPPEGPDLSKAGEGGLGQHADRPPDP